MSRRSPASRAIALCAIVVCAACGPAPQSPAPDTAQPITGAERFGWDQAATDLGELASLGFAIYLDDVRAQAADVTCGTSTGTAGFPCTCRLPAISAGTHTLQVAAYVDDAGTIRESARSVPLRVVKR